MTPKTKPNYKHARTRESLRTAAISLGAAPCPQCAPGWLQYLIAIDRNSCAMCGYSEEVKFPDVPVAGYAYPSCWMRGQLLNVRANGGGQFTLTPLGEEFDHYAPERALKFTDSIECQNFVSWWYSRESIDPRAG